MKIAFVAQAFGDKFIGGAEIALTNLATFWSKYTDDTIEIFTTTAIDHNWNSGYTAGQHIENGLTVNRYNCTTRTDRFFELLNKQQSGWDSLTQDEELEILLAQGPNSDELIDDLCNRSKEFDIIFTQPLLAPLAYFLYKKYEGIKVMHPCAHIEAQNQMHLYNDLLKSCDGLVFSTFAEQRYTNENFTIASTPQRVFGFGVEDIQPEGSFDDVKNKFELPNTPYILYTGRVQFGKNCNELVEYFVNFKNKNDLDINLVFAGPLFDDFLNLDEIKRDDIFCLGEVSQNEKVLLMENALTVCNLSKNESFSLVIIEGWLRNTPAIVSTACYATAEQILRSNAGYSVDNSNEFEKAIKELYKNPVLRKELGNNGREYALINYSWNEIIKNYREYFSTLIK